MAWTPETLARAFHESYARVAARAYGSQREPESWDSLSDEARALFVDACADLLGVEVEKEEAPQPPPEAVPVPSREEFEEAMETAPGDGVEERGDWYADLQKQIEDITAPKVRGAFKTAREPFRK